MLGFYREDRRAYSPPLGYCSGNSPVTSRRQSLQKRPSAKRACRGHHVLVCARLRHAAAPSGAAKSLGTRSAWRRSLGTGHCRLTSCMPESAIQFAKKPLALPFFSSTSPSQNRYAYRITSPKKKRKRQLQQRSRQKGTATQERWLFPFSCKRKVTAKKDGGKTPREASPHWTP